MRLSTVVAHKFFHLQDLLGFDKGSMTIAWLLSVSEASIMQLLGSVSAPRHGGGQEHGYVGNETVELEAQEGTAGIRRTRRRTTKIVQRPTRTKESRNEARRRARERTMTKRRNIRSGSAFGMMSGAFCHRQETNSDDSGRQLGSHGTSKETQEDLCPNWSQETRLDMEEQSQEQGLLNFLECQMDALRSIEKFLGIDSESSYSSISGDSTRKNSEESHRVLP
ncbi:PREDICTED: transcription factor TCP12 [Tarenaya hassleriana]|nr:PREDICTED: transcription factor TCP12 [Tarenaya hassleriana]